MTVNLISLREPIKENYRSFFLFSLFSDRGDSLKQVSLLLNQLRFDVNSERVTLIFMLKYPHPTGATVTSSV